MELKDKVQVVAIYVLIVTAIFSSYFIVRSKIKRKAYRKSKPWYSVILMYLIYFDWDKVKNILKEEISSNITWASMALNKREFDILNNGQEVPQQKKSVFKNLHGKILLILNKFNVAALKSLKIWWNKERFKVLP